MRLSPCRRLPIAAKTACVLQASRNRPPPRSTRGGRLCCWRLSFAGLGFAASARAGDDPPVTPALGSSLDSSQLVVTFKATTGAAAVSSTLDAAGVDQVGTVSLSGAAIVAVPELAAGEALATLKADPDAASVRVDPVVHVTLLPNDPVLNANHSYDWMYKEQNLPAAWDITTGLDAPSTVAVIDTGVASNHEDMERHRPARVSTRSIISAPPNAARRQRPRHRGRRHDRRPRQPGESASPARAGAARSCRSRSWTPSGYGTPAGHERNRLGHRPRRERSSTSHSEVTFFDPGLNVTALNYAVAHGVFVAVAAGNSIYLHLRLGPPGATRAVTRFRCRVSSRSASLDQNRNLFDFSNFGSLGRGLPRPGASSVPEMVGGYSIDLRHLRRLSSWVAGEAALALTYWLRR